jgi:hypothetical protein
MLGGLKVKVFYLKELLRRLCYAGVMAPIIVTITVGVI